MEWLPGTSVTVAPGGRAGHRPRPRPVARRRSRRSRGRGRPGRRGCPADRRAGRGPARPPHTRGPVLGPVRRRHAGQRRDGPGPVRGRAGRRPGRQPPGRGPAATGLRLLAPPPPGSCTRPALPARDPGATAGPSSLRRNCRSPSWPPAACPTGRSASNCSSPTARSDHTCTTCSPNSGSLPGPSSPTRSNHHYRRRRNSHQRARNKARPDADRGTTVRSE